MSSPEHKSLTLAQQGGEKQLQPWCPKSPEAVDSVRVFFTFAIDIADFTDFSEESLENLQSLRGHGGLAAIFLSDLATKEGFRSSAEKIRNAAEDAIGKGGKAVWSETFLQTRAQWRTPCSDHFPLGNVDDVRVGSKLGNHFGVLSEWTLDSCKASISVEGVIVLTASFSLWERIEVAELVTQLRELRARARRIFEGHVSELTRPGSPLRVMFSANGVAVGSSPIPERIRSHKTIFIKSLSCDAAHECEPHKLRDTRAVAGIMNLARWYSDYHEEYLVRFAKKEFGYRESELYLTDHDTTLAIQRGFWNNADPLHDYMGNVLEAIEYHVGLQSFFRGQLQYARGLYSMTTVDSPSQHAVDSVARSRAILSWAYESLNYSVLVLHGFTRLLLSRLDTESGIHTILENAVKRVENVSDAVSLQSDYEMSTVSHGLQKFGNSINGRVLLVTIISCLVSLVAMFVAFAALQTSSAAPIVGSPSAVGVGQTSDHPS